MGDDGNTSTNQIVIEDLAYENVVLNERVASLEADNRTYHELAVAGFDALRAKTLELKSLQRIHRDLREEYRQFRVRMLIGESASQVIGADSLPKVGTVSTLAEGAPCH